ncbi:DUF6273 domain-containing protein [Pseudobacillus sp. 179-B 2D1 NHS]|uniref:DUF6273 domain-containing protein n=1 Tax=Pseudobacillus sp. 179-B 2D1 NHS TaxID=3374292 RepID=UPI0038796F79
MTVNAQFISDLPLGAKVRMGNFKHQSDQESMVWKIVSKDHWKKDNNYPQNAVTIMADKILFFMAYDGKEPENALSDRARYGNNRYKQSNIRQWLNTDLGANEWFVPQNIAGDYHYNDRDTPPSINYIYYNTYHYPYEEFQGFLGMFRDYERDLFLKTKVKAATNPTFDFKPTFGIGKGSYDLTEDTFFLLSLSELGLGENKYNADTLDSIKEGETLEYFVQIPDVSSKASDLAFSKSPYSTWSAEQSGITYGMNFEYMTRSANLQSVHQILEISSNGQSTSGADANKYSGLKPAVNITNQTLVSLVPDEEGVYDIIADVAPVVEVLGTNVLTIDYTVRDMKGLTQEIKIFLNNELQQIVTTDLNSHLQFTLPHEKLLDGNNELIFVSKDNAGLERRQLFQIHIEKGSFNVGDDVAVTNETFEVQDVIDNLDGTMTITLNRNLKDTIKANETLENIKFNYVPHVFVTDDFFAQPLYTPMIFKRVSYDQQKELATEEWESVVSGSYCFTKLLLNRESIHEETFLKKISQVYNFGDHI